MEGEGRTTITVSRTIKDRFLEFIGAPKKYKSADHALSALLDNYENKDIKPKNNLEESTDGMHST